MGPVLAYKWLVSIGCCLLVVSGLTAQPAVSQPKRSGNDQVFQLGDIRVPALNDEQIRQLLITPKQIEQLFTQIQMEQQRALREAQRNREASLQWMRWLVSALAGAGGLWGVKQALRKRSSPAPNSPKPRVDRMGLGADGRGG